VITMSWLKVFMKTNSTRITCLVATFLLICSASLNVLLAQKVRQLREGIRLIKSEARLAEGSSVPPIAVRDVNGWPAIISYEQTGPPTLLYIFTPSCGWCSKNVANIQALAEQARDGYRIIGLSLSSENLIDYVAEHNLNFPVYEVSAEGARSYRLGGTPQSIVVSSDGKVLRNWGGAYSGSLQQDVERYFGVHLPGLAEETGEKASRNNGG
jgi:hypothetical protein